ncbi:hypothetical protein [Salinactinospora qingdaonensis]|uniref:Secreted protein n=1 Tax=Salinactinospora qingdaonensis TaxID=702744 RepID=A0ABP7G425_9ACTN
MRLLSALGMLVVLCVLLLSALVAPRSVPRACLSSTVGRHCVFARQARYLLCRCRECPRVVARVRPYLDRPGLMAGAFVPGPERAVVSAPLCGRAGASERAEEVAR